MTRTVDAALVGLGNVGRSLLHLLDTRAARLEQEYGLRFRIVAVADSSGIATAEEGFAPERVRQAKLEGKPARHLPGYQAGIAPAQAVRDLACDLVWEASPVNLRDGEPGLSICRAALERGLSVVLANKGPLALAFQELHEAAARHHGRLAFSATVCGALPVINIGRRDLIAAEIRTLRGIFNATSNFILSEMAAGRDYAAALAEAQRRGLAETDPSLDVEGWDTANKLVIIANSFLGVKVGLRDIGVQGITSLTTDDLTAARRAGQTIRLVASATRQENGAYALEVKPTALDAASFVAQIDGWEMGIEIESDLYGVQFYKNRESDPLPTASAMLRDAVNFFAPYSTAGNSTGTSHR
jgi:homoserine dehydrogenase